MKPTRRALLTGLSMFGLVTGAHARSVVLLKKSSGGGGGAVTPPVDASVRALAVGALTAAGVVLATLPAGTAMSATGAPANYFAINAATGALTVTAAGDTANLGTGTYDIPITGAGATTTLRLTVEPNTYDVDTDAALTAAETATASSLTTDWSIALPEGVWLTGRAFSRKYSGTLNNPNFGVGAADLIAKTKTLNRAAKVTVTGGSLTIKSRGERTSGFTTSVTASGGFGPLLFDRIDNRLTPSVDAYNAKFTNVTVPLIWTPQVDANGAVIGVASIQQIGVGYLASTNERRAYVSKKVGNTPVTISQASPAVITWPGHGLTVNAAVIFNSAGQIPSVTSTLPAGISTKKNDFVRTVLDADTFTIAATAGGTAGATTSAGSGTHLASAGTSFEGWFDVDDDGRITANSPLTITAGGSGHTTATAFSHYPLSETTQRALCQSNNVASRIYQYQISADSSGNVGDVAWNGCGLGTGSSGASDVRVCIGAFVRNANKAYFHDCVVNGYFAAFDIGMANDWEVARCFAVRGSNDFIDEYPAVASSNMTAAQIANGSKGRVYGNGVTRPLDIYEHSNEHADFHQAAAPGDIVAVRDFSIVGNYMYGTAAMRYFSNQGELNSLMGADLDQRQYIAGNFMLFNTVNGAQIGNARSINTAKYEFNTLIRYVDEFINDNGYANGINASVEPWFGNSGTWVSTTAYNLGQVVLYNGTYYQSLFNGAIPAGSLPDAAGSPYWVVFSGYEMDIGSNIIGAIWEHASIGGYIRLTDPTTSDGFTTAKNGDAAYASFPFRYRAQNNAYVNNYTANTGTGRSYPEVFSGGDSFFSGFAANTGFNGYRDKVRTDTLANMVQDINSAFTPRPGSVAAGRGHLALAA